jgi:hypothetical protein
MRLQAERPPDAAHHPVTDARRLGHRSRTPVRLPRWRRLERFTMIASTGLLAISSTASQRRHLTVSDLRVLRVSTVSDAAPPPAGVRATTTATMTSSFADRLHWSATGRTSASLTEVGPADLLANSTFAAVFDVASSVTYAFDGTGNVSESLPTANGGSNFADGVAFAFLSRIVVPGEDPVLEGVFGFQESIPSLNAAGSFSKSFSPQFAGTLAPGKYTFGWTIGGAVGGRVGNARLDPVSAHATSNFAFTLDFALLGASPTPEPASVLLLGTGILSMCALRSRRKDHAT